MIEKSVNRVGIRPPDHGSGSRRDTSFTSCGRRTVRIVDSALYVPEGVVDNDHLSRLTGRPPDWFYRVSGIRERRRITTEDGVNELALRAVAPIAERNPVRLGEVDYIIACSYTPWDTIGTIAHVVQRHYRLGKARAVLLSAACSSVVNALELVAALFESGRAERVLMVAAEHNSLYCNDRDDQSGHLWGDGAAALLLEAGQGADHAAQFAVIDVHTAAHGHVGEGPNAVCLTPHRGGLHMPHGREVFANACRYMAASARELLSRNELDVGALRLFVPHQANRRIMDHVAKDLGLAADQMASTIEKLGNTGSASVLVTLITYLCRLQRDDLVLLTVFGGGYSSGAALLLTY